MAWSSMVLSTGGGALKRAVAALMRAVACRSLRPLQNRTSAHGDAFVHTIHGFPIRNPFLKAIHV